MANFDLVPNLKALVNALVNAPLSGVGDKLPISIRKRYATHQAIYIFPEDGYDFLTSGEVERLMKFAEAYNCNLTITVQGDVPIIDICAWL